MFTVRELDNRLSLKLGDPVTNNGAGQLFDTEQRINYLSRAYGRLIRILKHIMGNYAPQFASTIKYSFKQVTEENDWLIVDFNTEKVYLEKVVESYLHIDNDRIIKYPIINIPNYKWLTTINEANDLQAPNISKGIVYGTIIENKYCIVPKVENVAGVELLYESSPMYFDSENMDQKVNISSEYLDVLLTIAAAEGMADAGRGDKFQMFVADVNNQITALANYITLQLQLEGKHSGK